MVTRILTLVIALFSLAACASWDLRSTSDRSILAAASHARAIAEPRLRAYQLAGFGRMAAERGDAAEAQRYFDEALQGLQSGPADAFAGLSALLFLAEQQAVLGTSDALIAALTATAESRLQETSGDLTDRTFRIRDLVRIGSALQGLGASAQSERLLALGLDLVAAEAPDLAVVLLGDFHAHYIRSGDRAGAQRIRALALKKAAALDDERRAIVAATLTPEAVAEAKVRVRRDRAESLADVGGRAKTAGVETSLALLAIEREILRGETAAAGHRLHELTGAARTARIAESDPALQGALALYAAWSDTPGLFDPALTAPMPLFWFGFDDGVAHPWRQPTLGR